MFGELLLIFPSTPFPSSAPSHHEGRGTLFGKYEHLFVTGVLDDYETKPEKIGNKERFSSK